MWKHMSALFLPFFPSIRLHHACKCRRPSPRHRSGGAKLPRSDLLRGSFVLGYRITFSCRRMKMVAASARVAVPWGTIVRALRPWIRPAPQAH